jgi:glycosyltransferase involved in cell wall biosynthesis
LREAVGSNMRKTEISAIIIAKNEAKKIDECLKSVKWCDEVILVDTGSIDRTNKIAKEYGAEIFKYEIGSYSDWRNEGLKHARGKWVLYVDADERVTALLRDEIIKLINSENDYSAYVIPRKNYLRKMPLKSGRENFMKNLILFIKAKLLTVSRVSLVI